MNTIPARLLGTALFGVCVLAFLTLTASLTAAPAKILVVTESKGFRHGPVKLGGDNLCLVDKTLAEIGKESGVFEIVPSQDAAKVLTRDNLKQFDALLFYTTGVLVPDENQREEFLEFVKEGKAFIGVHSATDTFKSFPGYYNFINGSFAGHPWNAGNTGTFVNHEPTHTTTKMFPTTFKFKDEIYQYSNYTPESVRVLISLDMAGSNPKRPYHVPVSWVRDYGKGRLFYTNFGHNEGSWKNDQFRAHLLAGIRWALKLDEGPSKPNPDVQALEHLKSFLVVNAGSDWTSLYAKAKSKDKAQLTQLREAVDACNKLPKNANEDRKAATAKIIAALQ